MSVAEKDFSSNYRAFNREIARTFQRAMDEARDDGQQRGLSVTEICVALVTATTHCAALAIVGADLPLNEFTGLLETDVADTRARHATTLAARGRPLQ